ncbi:MAG: hypothetical protein ACTSV0_07425 [Candidatus Freyarchaeota archaeon]
MEKGRVEVRATKRGVLPEGPGGNKAQSIYLLSYPHVVKVVDDKRWTNNKEPDGEEGNQ